MLAEALRRRRIDSACTSPLSRARETAEIVLSGRGVEIVVEERLKDFSYGDWTGLEEGEVVRRWPEEHALWNSHPERLRVPGGDALREVRDRAFAAMEEIAQKHEGEAVALFAHRVVNKLLVLGALGLGLERFPFVRQDNCCLSEFERRREGYVVVALNDTSHIRRAGGEVLTADF